MRIGDQVSFVPSAFMSTSPEIAMAKGLVAVKVTGTIVGIHRGHRWYRVRYQAGDVTLFECFPLTAAADETPPRYAAHHKGPRT